MNAAIDRTCEYQLAQQQGERAFFAKVVLMVATSAGEPRLSITMDRAVDPRWHSAAGFGVEYAWGQLARSGTEMPSALVRVVSVEWQPGDSTPMTVAFAAANALWISLEAWPARAPQLDLQSGSFVFPN